MQEKNTTKIKSIPEILQPKSQQMQITGRISGNAVREMNVWNCIQEELDYPTLSNWDRHCLPQLLRTPAVSVRSGRQSRTEGEITGILHEGSCGTGRGAQNLSVFSQAKLFHLSLWSRTCKQETPSKQGTQEIRCVPRSAYQWRWEAPRRQAVDTPCPAKHLLLTSQVGESQSLNSVIVFPLLWSLPYRSCCILKSPSVMSPSGRMLDAASRPAPLLLEALYAHFKDSRSPFPASAPHLCKFSEDLLQKQRLF